MSGFKVKEGASEALPPVAGSDKKQGLNSVKPELNKTLA